MEFVFTNAQMEVVNKQYAEQQLKAAAHELHVLAKGDFTLPHIEEALRAVATSVTPLGIKRMKWLKILTLWHLYPKAAPDAHDLGVILHDKLRSQDDRMNAAVALPVPTQKAPE